ncbi:MAG: septum formation initiator family protein [Oscillospiraceae bacterium]|nr:septum formation initiator family protein [Oscillospiraceae bacterium]
MKLKRAGIITKFIVLAMIVYATVRLVNIMTLINTAKAEQDALRSKITAKEVSNAALEYDIEHSGDDEVIAGIARDTLGLIMPNEKIYYDNGG